MREKPGKRSTAVVSDHQIRQRQHILTHAARLFADMGYAATTMDMLSAVTKMNKASLYYYFDSKQEILFFLLKEATLHAIEAASPAPKMKSAKDGLHHLVRAGLTILYSHFDATRIYTQENPYLTQTLSEEQSREILRLQRTYMKSVYEVIAAGMENGEFRKQNVRLVGALFSTIALAPVRFVSTIDKDEMTQVITNLLLDGLCIAPTSEPGA
jgi:AcrR family transcriptional regulator